MPGVLKDKDNGHGPTGVARRCHHQRFERFYVPENTAAFIFSQSGIENI